MKVVNSLISCCYFIASIFIYARFFLPTGCRYAWWPWMTKESMPEDTKGIGILSGHG